MLKKSVPGVEFHSIKCYNDFFIFIIISRRLNVEQVLGNMANKLEYNLQSKKKKKAQCTTLILNIK